MVIAALPLFIVQHGDETSFLDIWSQGQRCSSSRSSHSVTMATVDNQLGDTQLYPDQPGAGECTPRKKEAVDQDAVAETVEVKDSQDGLPPAEAAGGEEQPDQEAEDPAEEVQSAEEAAPSAESAASGLAGQEPMPVEQFDWSTLRKLPANYCGSCRMPVEADPTKRIMKKGHATLSCKKCHNVTTMLYKRTNLQTVGFKDIPPAQAWVLQNAFAKVSVF